MITDDRGLSLKEIAEIIFWMGTLTGLGAYIGPPAFAVMIVLWLLAGLLWLVYKGSVGVLKE